MKQVRAYIRSVILEQLSSYVKLVDIMDYPDQNELIWQFISPMDFKNTEFKVIVINPIEWFNNNMVDGNTTIKDVYLNFATKEQKQLVKQYQKQKINSYIIISENTYVDGVLLDGFHRLVAMALNGITSAKAIDLSEEK